MTQPDLQFIVTHTMEYGRKEKKAFAGFCTLCAEMDTFEGQNLHKDNCPFEFAEQAVRRMKEEVAA